MEAGKLFMTREQMDAMAKEEMEISDHIRYDDGFIVIDYGGYDYYIEINRLKTPASLLFWVLHLSEKNWMNPSRLRYFAELAAEINGFKLEAY